ncbi:MAG: three-Cys-motif partner protein TcmP [Bernardetiaceae bacterium]|nr:three-Cys-motif partner protein TcmP [Bernardetiaceae bacterium]
MQNKFGGKWTLEKIDIFLKYVPAYLKIMNKYAVQHNWKLLFIDGFAGSGGIIQEDKKLTTLEGVATRVLNIQEPRGFDYYRFVEKDKNKATLLRKIIAKQFPNLYQTKDKVKVYQDDFNQIATDLVQHLRKPPYENKIKTLAFVDPFGMSVNWSTIELFKKMAIDMWILIPTGMGVNRLLKKDGDINESWIQKLELFLGMSEEDIKRHFYTSHTTTNLFGEETVIKKQENAIGIAHELYTKRLNSVFTHISDAYVMRNSQNAILYHFLLASNNPTAIKIANDIIGKSISKL